MKIAQTFRDIKRLHQITNVLFKHELGYLIEKLRLKSHLTFHKRLQKAEPVEKSTLPKRIRLVMEELSGTFVKLGQLLSLRPDLIPKEYCKELSKLQDQVKPFPFEQVKEIIESELKGPVNKFFLSFDETPIAAASVGQVHKAVLKNSDIVAVKVQRPNIKKIFEADIDIMYHLATLLEKHIPEIKEYNPTSIIHEFEEYTKKELDYIVEANNINTFYRNFEKNRLIKVPRVYFDYTTKKVLTMEFIKGVKISDTTQIQKLRSSRRTIVENVTDIFIESVINHGFFHADPHPGNIFILPENNIALLDFGIVGHISQDIKEDVENLFIGLMKPDKNLIVQSLIKLGFIKDEINTNEFKEDLSLHLNNYYNKELKQISMSSFFYDFLALARKYKIKFPVNFILLIKAIITTEGFVKELDPEFNVVKASQQKLKKLIKKRTSQEYTLNLIKKNIMEFRELIKDIPKSTKNALKTIQEGRVKVDLEDSDIKRFALEIDKSSNRITIGLIIAALIISSALIMLANLPPYLYGMPGLGLILILIAIIFLIFLLISIIRERGGD